MKRLTAIFLTVTMIFSTLGIMSFSASAAVNESVILNMNFDNEAVGNLLTSARVVANTSNKVYTTNISNVKLSYTAGNGISSIGYVGVVDVSTDTTLKNNSALNNGKHTKVFKYLHNAGANGSFLMTKISSPASEDVSNHIVIVEYDAYTEPTKQQQLVLSPNTNIHDSFPNYLYSNTSLYLLENGTYWRYNSDKYIDNTIKDAYIVKDVVEYKGFNIENMTGKWHHIKLVYDATSKTGVYKDTYRIYVDGNLISSKFEGTQVPVYDFVGYYANNLLDTFGGLIVGGKPHTANGSHYYDNIKVTKLDKKFAIASKSFADNATNVEADSELTFTFTTPIDANTKDVVYIKDENGNKVTNGVTATVDTNDNTKLKVKLNSAVVEANKKYTVVFPGNFTDTYGQGLVSYYLYNINRTTYTEYNSVPKTADTEVSFTTAPRIVATATPSIVEDYDIGDDAAIEFDFGREIVLDDTIENCFSVVDENNNEISGLTGSVSTDNTKITVSLSGLRLGDGTHYITVVPGKIHTPSGNKVFASATIETVDFNVGADKTEILDYVYGDVQTIKVTSNVELKETEFLSAFDVKDENGVSVSGLKVEKVENENALILDISEIQYKKGNHTITTNSNFTDLRGRTAEFTITIKPISFAVSYQGTVSEYEIGTDKVIDISFTQPLSADVASNINSKFTAKNSYGMTVSGLQTSISDDKMKVFVQLSGLDISGGMYTITGNNFTAVNGDLVEEVKITLSTGVVNETIEDAGIASGSGSVYVPTTSSQVVIDDNFESYEVDVEWLDNTPSNWQIAGTNSSSFADDSVKVVTDPTNPSNKVLKISAGHYDAEGNVVSTGDNFNTVIRKPDIAVTSDLLSDPNAKISVKTKLYVDDTTISGFPIWTSNVEGENVGVRKGSLLNVMSGSSAFAVSSHLSRINSTKTKKNAYILFDGIPSNANGDKPTISVSTDARLELTAGAWHEVEYIFHTINGQKYFELLVDGVAFTGNAASDYKYWNALNGLTSFYGMMARIVSNSAQGAPSPVVYYDDWHTGVYYDLNTHIDMPKVQAGPDKNITLTFRNELTESSFASITSAFKLTDASGKTTPFTIVKNSGTSVTVVPSSDLRYDTEYVLSIDNTNASIVDTFGQKLPKTTYNFKTAKSINAAIDTENGTISYSGDIKTATEINYNMKLTQNAPNDLTAVVAIYSSNGTLISISVKTILAGADTQNFTLSAPSGGTEYVKMYLYDKTEGNLFGLMKQRPDEITAK